jgi:cell division protein FtsI (penicillin-binding protein 3)
VPRAPRTTTGFRARRRRRTLRLATGPFRLWSAFVGLAFVLSLFGARLIQLQGIDEHDYASLAVQKGAKTVTIETPRAAIYDRNGVALATSVDAAKLVADPTFTSDEAVAIATVLHERLGLDYLTLVRQLRKPETRYVELARHLDPGKAADVVSLLNDSNLPGVYAADDTLRLYPAGQVAANLLGYVNFRDKGKEGIEQTLDQLLSGKDGSATYLVGPDGEQLPLADQTVVEPEPGTGVRLTIDQDLQFLAQQRLAEAVKGAGGSSGSAIVMDVRNGQLLAHADFPSYDPNDYSDYQLEDFGSAALRDVYEPGSVQKVLTFAALIDAGYVTPRTKITVPPVLPRHGTVINDYFDHGTLRLTAAGVLAKSSNIGTVRAAATMPSGELATYLRGFGLGQRSGLELNGESRGLLTPADRWLPINHDTIAFGQGLSVNAVQMTAAIGAIANGGVYVQPTLVDGFVDEEGDITRPDPPAQHRVVSERTANLVARMMEEVTGEEGTAPTARIEGYRVAGKTGTAQRVDPETGRYSGFTVSFAGFAPADDPRFAVYVVVQDPHDGNGGGATGGPVFHDLMAAALEKYGVPPTGVRAPEMRLTW